MQTNQTTTQPAALTDRLFLAFIQGRGEEVIDLISAVQYAVIDLKFGKISQEEFVNKLLTTRSV